MRVIDTSLLSPELIFTASRSDGPGGQHVNKVSSKITLRFDVDASVILSQEEKDIIKNKLGRRLTKEGVIIISSQASRSQLQNKEDVASKFDGLLLKALEPVKPRKKTKPSKASKEKRIQGKKLQSDKKKWRQRP